MKPTLITAATVLALGVAAALPLPAAAQPPTGSALLARLDSDGDGAISRAEAQAARDRLFQRIDRNGDGMIDADEVESLRVAIADLATMIDAMVSLRARRLDIDGDRAVSTAEFARGGGLFDIVDRDGDGFATAEELAAFGRLMPAPR